MSARCHSASQGLHMTQSDVRSKELCDVFTYRVRNMAELVVDTGASAVVGGVTPCDLYSAEHQVSELTVCDRRLAEYDLNVISYFGSLHGAHGGWKAGMCSQGGQHPSDVGHRLMFESVDLERCFGSLRRGPR